MTPFVCRDSVTCTSRVRARKRDSSECSFLISKISRGGIALVLHDLIRVNNERGVGVLRCETCAAMW